MDLTPGNYFGEMALLKNQPRAANVVADGKCKCLIIDRASFTRLLGKCEDIMGRQMDQYED